MDGGERGTAGNRGLVVDAERREQLLEDCVDLPHITLTPRQLADLELLLNGGFAPLTGFMTGVEYITVCCEMRLPDERLWPMPVTLAVEEAVARNLRSPMLALRDRSGVVLAVLHVEDVWQPDLLAEAAAVFGTVRDEHVGVATLARQPGNWYVGGRVEGLQLPEHHDFRDLRKTPTQLRARFQSRGWQRVLALPCHAPLHPDEIELARRTAELLDAGVLIHATVGPTPGPGMDLDPLTRVRCHRAASDHLPEDRFELAVLPLAMRMAGPREALWHALIRKNFGCTHVLVGPDHAGPGVDSEGEPFYKPDTAQKLVQAHAAEIGIEVVPVANTTETRSFPEVEQILQDHRRPKGCTVFFTGLPGSGKSTVAGILASSLRERGVPVTLLDDGEVHPLGRVAAEITRHGGLVLCASPPQEEARQQVRRMVEEHGRFLLVHVDTPGFVCQARAGRMARTWVADLYEEPLEADLVVGTMVRSPEESAELVLEHLLELGMVPEENRDDVVIPAVRSRSEPVTGRSAGRRSVSVLPKTGQ